MTQTKKTAIFGYTNFRTYIFCWLYTQWILDKTATKSQ